MRLFVAVGMSAEVAGAARELVTRLRDRAARLAPASRIRWVAPDRLHVTVRFIGHMDEGRAMAIRDALHAPISLDPFDLTVASVGTFPSEGPPRVVWSGLSHAKERLVAAERLVSDRLAAVGIPPDDRPYNPHLTLGRVREPAGLKSRALLDGVRDTTLGVTAVAAITLYESRQSSEGPTYVALQTTPLAR